jgi:hypothetical protein
MNHWLQERSAQLRGVQDADLGLDFEIFPASVIVNDSVKQFS